MREYLSLSNLRRASLLGSLVTLMSIPRIMQAGMDLTFYVPAALTSMILVSGAATAWGRHAGMCGLFPGRRRMWAGIGIATTLSLLLLPVYECCYPFFERAIQESSRPGLAALQYPTTIGGCLALMLWSAGFETMFFRAATISLLARLSHRQWVAVSLSVILCLGATQMSLAAAGIKEARWAFYASAAAANLVGVLLFARTGLPAAMVFAAGLQLHLLLRLR